MRRQVKSIDAAKSFVSENFNEPVEMLLIADSLNDSMGINMAIILDEVLKKGYMPDGFEQKDGYRIYKYTRNE